MTKPSQYLHLLLVASLLGAQLRQLRYAKSYLHPLYQCFLQSRFEAPLNHDWRSSRTGEGSQSRRGSRAWEQCRGPSRRSRPGRAWWKQCCSTRNSSREEPTPWGWPSLLASNAALWVGLIRSCRSWLKSCQSYLGRAVLLSDKAIRCKRTEVCLSSRLIAFQPRAQSRWGQVGLGLSNSSSFCLMSLASPYPGHLRRRSGQTPALRLFSSFIGYEYDDAQHVH